MAGRSTQPVFKICSVAHIGRPPRSDAAENQGNCMRKFPPFGAVLEQRAMAGSRDAVVPSLPAVLGSLVRFDHPVALQLVKRRVEGALLEVEDASRALLDP